MGKQQIQGEIVKDYLERYPKTATMTLAKMIYRENKEAFASVEHARTEVRYYRGATGNKARKEITTKEHFRVTDTHNPFNLPEPNEDRQVLPFTLPREYNNILILSDLHIPYQDNRAITAALEYAVKNRVDSLVINGDGMDFFAASKFAQDPRKRDLGNEIEKTRQFVKEMGRIFKRKLWKDGNHEERWKKYLWVKAPELTGVEIFELENIIELPENGFTYVDSRAEILVGNNFTIVHGHEFQESVYSPVNPARGLYLRYEDNAICGHFHRPSHHAQKTGRGKIKATWSLGCLCLLRPEYATQNKWIHGFAHLTRETVHDFHVRNFKIIDGKIYEG